jgi:hypothetical protein
MPPIINIYFRSNVVLKKVTGKYILKSTLTPKLARKEFEEHTAAVQKSVSSPIEFASTSSTLPTPIITQVCNLLIHTLSKRSSHRDYYYYYYYYYGC